MTVCGCLEQFCHLQILFLSNDTIVDGEFNTIVGPWMFLQDDENRKARKVTARSKVPAFVTIPFSQLFLRFDLTLLFVMIPIDRAKIERGKEELFKLRSDELKWWIIWILQNSSYYTWNRWWTIKFKIPIWLNEYRSIGESCCRRYPHLKSPAKNKNIKGNEWNCNHKIIIKG